MTPSYLCCQHEYSTLLISSRKPGKVLNRNKGMRLDPFVKMFVDQYKQPAFIDEVGLGSIFGELVACAVMIPEPFEMKEVNDSKKLKHEDIYRLAPVLRKKVLFAYGVIPAYELNEIKNMHKANLLAMKKALEGLSEKPDGVFIDGRFVPKDLDIPVHPIVKGDTKVFGIAVASIIAKDYRDHLMMIEYGTTFDDYDIAQNKGYRSPTHLKAIRRLGTTLHHRRWLPDVLRAADGN